LLLPGESPEDGGGAADPRSGAACVEPTARRVFTERGFFAIRTGEDHERVRPQADVRLGCCGSRSLRDSLTGSSGTPVARSYVGAL